MKISGNWFASFLCLPYKFWYNSFVLWEMKNALYFYLLYFNRVLQLHVSPPYIFIIAFATAVGFHQEVCASSHVYTVGDLVMQPSRQVTTCTNVSERRKQVPSIAIP